MSVLPTITDTFRVVQNWFDDHGQNAVNVIHVRYHGGSAALVGDIWASHHPDDLYGTVINGARFDSLSITPLDGASATTLFPLSGSASQFAGTASGDPIPQVAGMVKLTTGLRGRSFRGRLFLPFTGEAVVDAGFVASGTVASMQTAWDTWMANVIAAGAELVVASYKLAVATSVESIFVETATGTQRRRQQRNR